MFKVVGKSEPNTNVRRGGVAVYLKKALDLECVVYENICPDTVVFSIKGTRVLVVAVYVTPENSRYKNPSIFMILQNIIESFKEYKIYVIGDFNARCGTPEVTKYTENPDKGLNSYGKKLLALCMKNKLCIVNGLKIDMKTFDSKFTFFRGNLKSQNDWCITNRIQTVRSFVINEKLNMSDHTPLSVEICVSRELTLDFIAMVSRGTFSYEAYDRSKTLRTKVTMETMNTDNLVGEFDDIAAIVTEMMNDEGVEIDVISNRIVDSIYNTCSSRRSKQLKRIPDEKKNLTSRNFQAIATANLNMYSLAIQRNDPGAIDYYNAWVNNHEYALSKEKEEYNEKVNSQWKTMAKDNPKKLWKVIDYKDKAATETNDDVSKISEKAIQKYFRGIFQDERLSERPTISDVREAVDEYNVYIPLLDDDFTLNELNVAIQKNGKGMGLDSLDKRIANLFTVKLRECILKFFNQIYGKNYPDSWKRLLLRPEKKKGHTSVNPKLRGVAISQLLPTLYDIMIYNRFNLWYVPNKEQAGSRLKQGCLIQIFAIYVIMEFMKSIGKCLYLGFLDYEKAFDFVNRFNVVTKLMNKGAGARFTRAIADMYDETFYVPKICNKIGDEIAAKHGVTQGRQSSTSLFSFEVKELAENIVVPQSCLYGHHVLQLADDTGLMAEDTTILCDEFGQCFAFSKRNYMSANIDKTVFLPLTDDHVSEPLHIDEETVINIAEDEEYLYLGMWFIASSELLMHMDRNLQKRAFHSAKYFDWLHVNEWTPVNVKIHVLYMCVFSAYLYGAETWWKLNLIQKKVLTLERKLLKAVLCVKSNTPDAILYLELDRPDIIAIMKDRQYKFFQNLISLDVDESVASKIVHMFRHLPICSYYDNLQNNNVSENKRKRVQDCAEATTTYLSRYHGLIDKTRNHVIYDSYLHERLRIVITRWRVSNHSLRIETGRYETPPLPRGQRVCTRCEVLEDEHHAIFVCPRYDTIRRKHATLIQEYARVEDIFNPGNVSDATRLGNMLLEVEQKRKDLGLTE
jgi:hypothetical protein